MEDFECGKRVTFTSEKVSPCQTGIVIGKSKSILCRSAKINGSAKVIVDQFQGMSHLHDGALRCVLPMMFCQNTSGAFAFPVKLDGGESKHQIAG